MWWARLGQASSREEARSPRPGPDLPRKRQLCSWSPSTENTSGLGCWRCVPWTSPCFRNSPVGSFLVAQCFKLCAFTTLGPSWGTKIPQVVRHSPTTTKTALEIHLWMDPRDQWIPAVRDLGEDYLLPTSRAGHRLPVSAGGWQGCWGRWGDMGMTSGPTPPAPAGPCAIKDTLAWGSHDPSSSLCFAQVLFILGALIFAMSLQLDRRAAWNTMGPCLFAIVVMVTMWVRTWGRQASCPDPLHWKLGYKSVGSLYLLTLRGQSVAPRSVHVLIPGSVSVAPHSVHVLIPGYLCSPHPPRAASGNPQGPSVAWHPLNPSKQPTLAALGSAPRYDRSSVQIPVWFPAGIPLRAPAPLLPPLLAALGLLPPARPLHGCSGPHHLCFHDDQRKLLLHPQHLAHAAGRERSLLAAAKGTARRALGLRPEAHLPL